MNTETFLLTKNHIKLLRRMFVGWQDCETGAPEIDPKRPYGNRDVNNDIHEILTGECVGSIDSVRKNLTDEEEKKYSKLHKETEIALQIVLFTGEFKSGLYKKEKYTSNWKYINQ